MVSTDPIADMLSRIRNAILVRQDTVKMPYSKIKEAVAKVLVEYGFIDSVKAEDGITAKQLIITINSPLQNARITEVARLSTPGRRLYSKADDIPSVKQGRGIVVVSTSKGVMSGEEAKKQRLGGELICKVY